MAIQALFLDFGNVFSTFDMSRFFKGVQTKTKVELTREEIITIHKRHYPAYDSGKINFHEYYQGFMKDAGEYISPKVFEEAFLDIFTGHVVELRGLLDRVKEDIPIYLISNTNEVHYEGYIRLHPFLLEHIPVKRHILSFRVGMSKPDPRIYQRALGVAGVDPGEGFFVDDVDANVRAWKDLGGEGVVWHGSDHKIAVLEEALREHEILA